MGLNRLMMGKKTSSAGGGGTEDNAFIMTMGMSQGCYGYSRYIVTVGEIEGSVQHEGKAITLVMLLLVSSGLGFAFNIEGATSGRLYNATVKVTSMETNTTTSIEVPGMTYQSDVPGPFGFAENLTSDVTSLFSQANVGKKFKVEIIFNL